MHASSELKHGPYWFARRLCRRNTTDHCRRRIDEHWFSAQLLNSVNVSQQTDTFEFYATEHFRLSGVYWGLTAMALLGRLHEMDGDAIVAWVLSCQVRPQGPTCRRCQASASQILRSSSTAWCRSWFTQYWQPHLCGGIQRLAKPHTTCHCGGCG